MKHPSQAGKMFLRICIYIFGLLILSLGIVLSKKTGLGIAPVSTIPLVMEKLLPLTFGQVTMLFYLVNITAQCILNPERKGYIKILLQIPASYITSYIMDLYIAWIPLEGNTVVNQIILLTLSVLLVGLGVVLVVHMDLMPNPPDGTVRVISLRTGMELGTVKNIFDISCVVISTVLSLILFHRVYSFGVATVVTTLFVGRFVRLFGGIGRRLHELVVE